MQNDGYGKDREARISKEIKRLNKILKPKENPKLMTAQRLIENVAFMSIHLQDLQAELNENGCTEKYQNGENQYGVKKSAAFDAYTSTVKNYMTAIKQLVDAAPDGVVQDDLSILISGGRR